MYTHKYYSVTLGVLGLIMSAYFVNNYTQNTAFLIAKNDKEITIICHHLTNTLEVSEGALQGHLNHGDTLGPCPDSSSSSSSDESSSSSGTGSSISSSSSSISSGSGSTSSSSSGSSLSSSSGSSLSSSDSSASEVSDSSSSESSFSSTEESESSAPQTAEEIREKARDATDGSQSQAFYKGHGLGEHAATLYRVLHKYELTEITPYQFAFQKEDAAIVSNTDANDWVIRAYAAGCSIYRYLERQRELRQGMKPGYVDWITQEFADTLELDPVEVKASILGFPQDHPVLSSLARSVAHGGCVDTPYTAGVAFYKDSPVPADMHHAESEDSQGDFTVSMESLDAEIVFSIMQGASQLKQYGKENAEQMHVVFVRKDLDDFHHVEALRDKDDLWHIPFVPEGGEYWFYLDVVTEDGERHVLHHKQIFEGKEVNYNYEKNFSRIKTIEDYTVELEVESYDFGVLFHVNIEDQLGATPFLEPHHNILGHVVVFDSDQNYIHSHPSKASDTISFRMPKAKSEWYRLFVQFKIQGVMHTVKFDWLAPKQ